VGRWAEVGGACGMREPRAVAARDLSFCAKWAMPPVFLPTLLVDNGEGVGIVVCLFRCVGASVPAHLNQPTCPRANGGASCTLKGEISLQLSASWGPSKVGLTHSEDFPARRRASARGRMSLAEPAADADGLTQPSHKKPACAPRRSPPACASRQHVNQQPRQRCMKDL